MERTNKAALTLQLFKMAELPTAFALAALLARGLGPAEFATYLAAMALVSLLACALGLGGEELLQRAGSATEDLVRTVVRTRKAVILAAFLIACGAAVHSGGRIGLACLLALALGFSLPVNLFAAAAIRRLQPFVPAAVSLGGLLAQIALVVLSDARSARAGIAVYVVAQALELGVLAVHARRTGSVRATLGRFDATLLRTMLVVMLLNFIALVLGRQSDLVIGRWVGAASGDIANYGIAFTVVIMANSVLVLGIGAVTLKSMALSMEDGLGEVGRRWRSFLSITSFLSLPVLVLVGGTASTVVRLGFGANYHDAAQYLQLFVLSFVLIRLAGGGTNIGAMLAMKRERTVLKVLIATGGANVLLDVVLIPMIGMGGALLASTVANVAAGLALTYVMRQATGVGPPVKYYARLLVATCAGLPALAAGSHYGVGLTCVGALVYAATFAGLSCMFGVIPRAVRDLGSRRGGLLRPRALEYEPK